MTQHDPPRMRELELRDSELSELLDAVDRDVAPPDVLARSAHRLSAAIGISHSDPSGLGAPPVESIAAAKTGAASAAAKSAATVAAAKGAAAITPMLAAVAKPLLVVAHASATSVAVWSGQRERPEAPAGEPPRISAPAAPAQSAAPVPPAAPVTPSVPALPAQRTAQEISQVLHASEPPRARPARTHRSAAATRERTQDEELRSLQRAQAELALHPADAVRRLREHAKTWPNGWLDEERAALLVEALLRAGERSAAEQALAELRAHRPRSPALPRLARMLARPDE
jgi:hypothetical protein